MLLEADNFLAFLSDNAIPLVLGLSVLDEGLPPRRVNQTETHNKLLPLSHIFEYMKKCNECIEGKKHKIL